MDTLSDELLKRIAGGSGRCYSHEGKSMATELLARRKAAVEAAQAAQAATNPAPLYPYP